MEAILRLIENEAFIFYADKFFIFQFLIGILGIYIFYKNENARNIFSFFRIALSDSSLVNVGNICFGSSVALFFLSSIYLFFRQIFPAGIFLGGLVFFLWLGDQERFERWYKYTPHYEKIKNNLMLIRIILRFLSFLIMIVGFFLLIFQVELTFPKKP